MKTNNESYSLVTNTRITHIVSSNGVNSYKKESKIIESEITDSKTTESKITEPDNTISGSFGSYIIIYDPNESKITDPNTNKSQADSLILMSRNMKN